MSDSHAAKAAEAGAAYYPPPPPGPPPPQSHDLVHNAPEPYNPSSPPGPPQSSTSAAPPYAPVEVSQPTPLQSHPPAYYNDSKTEHHASASAPAPAPGPTASGAAFTHFDDHPLPNAYVPHDADSEEAAKGSSFSKWGKKLQQYGEKAAFPINNFANKMGMQSFLPMTMDRECEKAAGIITSFTKDGVVVDKPVIGPDGKPTKEKGKALIKIPPKVIARAVGVVIFTAMRAGFQISGTTGSGVLVARLPDGSWSPPSGIQIASLGGGFLVGVEVHDCVLIINSPAALAAFLRTRVSLGPEVAVAVGPYGAGGGAHVGAGAGSRGERGSDHVNTSGKQTGSGSPVPSSPGATATPPTNTPMPNTTAPLPIDNNLKPDDKKHKRASSGALKPVFSYVKSKGFYAGVQVDGTVIVERKEANAAFYGRPIGVERIIRGGAEPGVGPQAGVPTQRLMWPQSGFRLLEALNKADAAAQQAMNAAASINVSREASTLSGSAHPATERSDKEVYN
ncbi:uncharacterized protein BROUX77_007410 [Berkeleyomyces rouxiae]|uniref:uncharacterized protein n=1 Tax=Berkeleyomyces rouxiae TaxID=2035830 RepID=UPI003B79BBC8